MIASVTAAPVPPGWSNAWRLENVPRGRTPDPGKPAPYSFIYPCMSVERGGVRGQAISFAGIRPARARPPSPEPVAGPSRRPFRLLGKDFMTVGVAVPCHRGPFSQ
ncbi:hypothetical protein GCM10017559_14750 [Streptosporangium longisporum]|uniref:Uncharacterized protein n=1 Tax=Streptosporangium longisporum TaxID=46187 RepID=A0ABN3XUB9_9ACTN